MNKKIFIFGAGSIGNHMANANLRLKNQVSVTDIDYKSLIRMKNKIFPSRYGKWNSSINLIDYNEAFKKRKFDLIIIGTPPTTHLPLIKKLYSSQIQFDKVLIEKPLSSFKENNVFLKKFNKKDIFIGYNHSVSISFSYFLREIKKEKQKINNIFINWKEGFEGILKAHKWLKNEYNNYLGYSKLGGGAIQEHSHGLHLAIVILNEIGVSKYQLKFYKQFAENNPKLYDNLALVLFNSKKMNLKLDIDLITFPSEKNIIAEFNDKKIIWIHNYKKNHDGVKIIYKNSKEKIKLFKKTRSSEFENEIKYIFESKTKKNYHNSRLNILYGIKVMHIIKKFFNDKKNSF